MHILLVDDDPTQRAIFRAVLERGGYTVTEAASGAEAWALIERGTFALVVTDWLMPDMSGLELIKQIRATPLPHYVYTIINSIRKEEADVIAGIESGADDYLIKPIKPAELLARARVGQRVLTLERNLRTMHDQMRHYTSHDELTGLLNRRTFYHQAVAELGRATRNQQPLSVLLMDIDYFKQVNDRFGHSVGDLLLKQIAKTLRDNSRVYDLVARWGGEEFALVLPNTDREEAGNVAERLRMDVARTRIKLPNGQTIHRCISIGGAVFAPQHGDSFADVVRRADSALYEAKFGGRNRTIIPDH